ncbi:hypothetical protein CSE45_5246 [Citreicella sp. SE45]|nr:hypothetical protein CSE45_5246 [Citreicella sp. SE45]
MIWTVPPSPSTARNLDPHAVSANRYFRIGCSHDGSGGTIVRDS